MLEGMAMSANKVVLVVGVLLSIAACDKKDDAAAPSAATASAAAASAAPGEMERKDREHGREERADGGREHEHEEHQPK
jgi:hypothetical protein